jgi:hypothetical protein
MAASHPHLVQALGHDKCTLSHGLANLEAKGLVTITRTPGGKAEALRLTFRTPSTAINRIFSASILASKKP